MDLAKEDAVGAGLSISGAGELPRQPVSCNSQLNPLWGTSMITSLPDLGRSGCSCTLPLTLQINPAPTQPLHCPQIVQDSLKLRASQLGRWRWGEKKDQILPHLARMHWRGHHGHAGAAGRLYLAVSSSRQHH